MSNREPNIHCAHVVAGLHPNAGGPSRTVVQLADALSRLNVKVSLLSQVYGTQSVTKPVEQSVILKIGQSNSRLALKLGLPLRRILHNSNLLGLPTIIHSHGLWSAANFWAFTAARRHGVPLIVHPRGMLEPWALNHKKLKKYIALKLYQQNSLNAASVLVATAGSEYENLRALGLSNPIAIIPNGVVMELFEPHGTTNDIPRSEVRTILFLSRVQEKKGLINLVQAWAQLKPVGWRLQIAGPDENGHLRKVIALAQHLGIDSIVEYVGVVDGVEKAAMYRSADVFVLPTYSENFGVAVAEALASGLPVITTKGAPWSDLEKYNCGWWIDIGVQPLVTALREAMALSDDERRAMGARGRNYVQRYDWNEIASQMTEVYRWVSGQGPKPDCIQVD